MQRQQETANREAIANTAAGVSQRSSEIIFVPTKADVLFGRRRPQQQYTGKVRCNYFVVANRKEYKSSSRNGKNIIAQRVIDKIKADGGRFFKTA
jgi:hypothetical protein